MPQRPGYGIVDVTAWWEPGEMPGLRVNAGVYNVFDKTYYDAVNTQNTFTQPAEYYSEPGRTFRVAGPALLRSGKVHDWNGGHPWPRFQLMLFPLARRLKAG